MGNGRTEDLEMGWILACLRRHQGFRTGLKRGWSGGSSRRLGYMVLKDILLSYITTTRILRYISSLIRFITHFNSYYLYSDVLLMFYLRSGVLPSYWCYCLYADVLLMFFLYSYLYSDVITFILMLFLCFIFILMFFWCYYHYSDVILMFYLCSGVLLMLIFILMFFWLYYFYAVIFMLESWH